MAANKPDNALISRHETPEGSLRSYTTGFVLSLVFTIIPFVMVMKKVVSGNALVATLLGFASVQFVVQAVFFLHLGRETKPRWKLVVLLFALLVICIVVIGSLWIMYNLNYYMMPEHEVEKHIMEEEAIHR
jgi:cytochrome o ubiquinol oxidase subunit IV